MLKLGYNKFKEVVNYILKLFCIVFYRLLFLEYKFMLLKK